jgi:hypothetical protein
LPIGDFTGCEGGELLIWHADRQTFLLPCINSIRAHFAELGIVAPVGRNGMEELLEYCG